MLRRTVFSSKPAPMTPTGELTAENFSTFVKHTEQQFKELAKSLTRYIFLQMHPLHVEPEKPREGMLAFADGSDWNPGAGKGLYVFDGALWRSAGGWNHLYKEGDESTASDTTFSDDSALVFPVVASGKYVFWMEVWYETPTAADFKWQVAGPTSPTLVRVEGFALPPGATSFTVTRDSAFAQSHALVEVSGTAGYLSVRGILHNGANAGNVALQWAQNTSNAGATIVRAGSSLSYRRIA